MGRSMNFAVDETATPASDTKKSGGYLQIILIILSFLFILVLVVAVVFVVLYFVTPGVETKVYPWVRLPTDLAPSYYDLYLLLNLDDGYFTGSVTITFACALPTKYIVLHSHELEIFSVELASATTSAPTVSRYEEDDENEFLIIELTSFLLFNSEYELTISFKAYFVTEALGFYITYNADDDYSAFYSTQFQATGARRVFPCFDEPSYKSVFRVTLDYPDEFHALTNGDLDYSISSGDGRVEDHFQDTFKMSTYLVAFYISTAVNQTTYVNGTRLSVWAPESQIEYTTYQLSAAAKVLQFYYDLFDLDIDYTIIKADNAIVDANNFRGMENWGLILYSKLSVLYDEENDPDSQKLEVQEITCHEFTHYWTGNLVTTTWWDELWMNEGITSFLTFLCQDAVFNDTNYELATQRGIATPLLMDAYVTSDPLRGDLVITLDEIIYEFSYITYTKGAAINWMMYDLLGEDIYMTGLKNMMTENVYGLVTTDDIIRHWYLVADDEDFKDLDVLEEMINTWTMQMGYPLLTVGRNTRDEVITITQSHFLLNPEEDENLWYSSPYEYSWIVPVWICYKEGDSCDNPKLHIMTEKTEEITLTGLTDDGWLIVNPRHGYYRVNYADSDWDLIQTELYNNPYDILETTRLHLISDIFHLAREGSVTIERALELAVYMKNETSLDIWEVYVTDIKYFLNVLNDDADALEAFKKYLQKSIFDELFDSFSSASIEDENNSTIRSYIEALACAVDTEACVTISVSEYNDWLSTDTTIDYFNTIACTALRNAGDDYDTMTEAAFDRITRYTELFPALACINSSDMTTLLKSAMNEGKVWSYLEGMFVKTRTALDVLWYGYSENWDYLTGTQLYEKDNIDIMNIVVKYFNRDADIVVLDEFIETHLEDVDGVPRYLDNLREKVRVNIYFLDNCSDDIEDLSY